MYQNIICNVPVHNVIYRNVSYREHSGTLQCHMVMYRKVVIFNSVMYNVNNLGEVFFQSMDTSSRESTVT